MLDQNPFLLFLISHRNRRHILALKHSLFCSNLISQFFLSQVKANSYHWFIIRAAVNHPQPFIKRRKKWNWNKKGNLSVFIKDGSEITDSLEQKKWWFNENTRLKFGSLMNLVNHHFINSLYLCSRKVLVFPFIQTYHLNNFLKWFCGGAIQIEWRSLSDAV